MARAIDICLHSIELLRYCTGIPALPHRHLLLSPSLSMPRTPTHHIGIKGADELSAVERERLQLARNSRLEPHFLGESAAPAPKRNPPLPERLATTDPRDPQELHRGIEVSYLSDSAFGDLFNDPPA